MQIKPTGKSSVDPGNVTDRGQSVVPPPPCPACEAAAKQIAHRERQIAALIETIDGWESKYLISRQHNEKLADENYRLAMIEQELADLRARLEAECEAMDTTLMELYAIGEVLAVNEVQPHLNRLRALLRKEDER